MSFDIVKIVEFPQEAFQYVPQEILGGNTIEEFPTLGGTLSDAKHLWHAKGPCLEIRNTVSGRKVGSWIFGGILKDSITKIIAVDELKRPHGRLSLLLVALECTISGGLMCVFDIFGSKVLRVVQVREQITNIHVIDSGCENSILPEPSALRYFDGIVAVGTLGGNVYLLDICRQICENVIQNMDSTIRDELNPCPMVILNKEEINNIRKYVQDSIDKEEHLAVHLNVILNSSTEHFILKGEKGEDRVHVNNSEAEVSSLCYSSQIASLLVGYNFGAFQLWDLRSLKLVYTSPICEGNIPVMHFTVQEPADDPKAYCYIWVSYSHNLMFHSGLPFAVMYSFYYNNKSYINNYGNLYENFQHCSVRFQIELGETETPTYNTTRVKGGTCIGLQSINKHPINKEVNTLSLCLISWLTWNNHKEVNTSVLLFDLNQWYKEQMPRAPNWSNCSNYIIKNSLNNQVLDIRLDQKSLSQFIGIQRLEEHFCPTSLSFDLWCITENSILKVHNKGLQQAFIDKIVDDQHLCLVRPEDYFEQITSLGLVPLFCDVHLSNSLDVNYQREILLNVALEQKLVGWLCKCTLKLANNAFNASGLSIYNVLNWALERAITLKNACDKYCISLFDFSGTRLDSNTIALLNSSTGQIRNICSLYRYISSKLMNFISDKEALLEERKSLENVVVYFEVLLWMVNIGLLPECQLKHYQSYDDSFTSAPYLVNDLTEYYSRKRAQMQMASHDTFVEKDCLLYIDNLINIKGGAEILQQQWQEDGGSGLYPPPSLQSVLRTYFLDGPDLVFKHCLVTYTLLDIAMTVDENNRVIKLLLKFPQIFDLSQSNIKIVQAFWHLDHDDYETALEYILDPCVLTEDLQRWHHSVMMRSLLLQDQSSLALLYLQIRKPSIQDEKDLLTVISLLISKNMLDEAFRFRQQHQNVNEHSLLVHIFNECNKNEQLHSLLYRRLNNGEEKAFFKYLQNTKNPRCEDLKVFYYLLRSRFLEAFDSYSLIKRKKPENQGLIGQRDATTADNIVKMFKTLLPDVNKNLVELVQKERTNLWKEVRKPTPLSVFVHNARDQVQYKSSVIFAALAKAKQTFNDTLNDTRMNNEVVTEETPFLRTPTVFRNGASVGTPLMKSRVIEQNEQGEEYSPSPCKKLKLSPRTSKTSPIKSRNRSASTIQSKLSTPIIRRNRRSAEETNTITVLPQSILKGSSTSRTILDDSIFDGNTSVNTSLQLECENSVRRSRLALTPRKPVGRTPVKSHVKFQDIRYSNSSNEQSSRNENILLPETSGRQSIDSTASTAEEEFYSPDSSPKDIDDNSRETVEEKLKNQSLSPVRERLTFEDTVTEEDVVMEEQPKEERKASAVPVEDNDLSPNRLTFQSPRSRKSYKRSFDDSPTPVRSSPRLAKKAPQNEEDSTTSETTFNKSEALAKPSPSIAVQKLRGRRSLSRAVLENNAFSQLRSSSIFERSPLLNKSGLSSLNTTATNDSESEIYTDESHNDSLEELLAKYRTSALSFNTNDSLLSDSDKNEDGEVVSKTTEVQSTETYKETIRKADTQEVVSSQEATEEYRSKQVEVYEQDELQGPSDKNPVDSSIFEEATQDFNVNVSENVEDDNKSEAANIDVSDNELVLGQDKNDETKQGDEEINVYEDLSSGSEDIRAVLRQFRKTEEQEEKVYADVSLATSASYYHKRQMPEDFLESGQTNSNDDASKSPQPEQVYDDIDMDELFGDIPPSEKALVGTGEVIEICSSSEDGDSQIENKQEIDDSSSSSYSDENSYSSKDESNDSDGSPERVDETRSVDEENSSRGDDFREADESKSFEDRAVDEDRETAQISNGDLDQKTEEIEKSTHEDLDESSESSVDDASTDQQFDLDQKEIADAIKMLQAEPEALVEEQLAPMADDEYMDSLILEGQSPDKEEPRIVHEEPDVVIDDTQKEIENDSISNENLKDKEATEDTKSIVYAKEASPREIDSHKLKTSEDVQLIAEEPAEPDHEATTKDLQRETIIASQKQSKSLQCTLGADDSLIDSSEKDNSSVFLTPNESADPKGQVLSESDPKTVDVTEKDVLISDLKQSKSVQCTLGVNDSIVESVFQNDAENMILIKDQVIAEDDAKDVYAAVEETSISPFQKSKNIQCTLVKDSIMMDYSADDTSVFIKDNEEKDRVSPESEAERMDLTEKENDPLMDCSEEDEVDVPGMSTPNNEAGTPLVVKTVKKTYRGRKTSEASETVDLDATPKLAVSLTKRTYSKKDSGVDSKLMDVESSQAETQDLPDDKQENEEAEVKNEETEVGNEETEAKNEESKVAISEETEIRNEETEAKNKDTKNVDEEPVVHIDVEQQNEGVEAQEKEPVENEMSGSTKQAPLEKQDTEEASRQTDDKHVDKGVETSQDKDISTAKNEETAVSTPAVRMTRRRSMLLSQQEGTPSSLSENSVGDSGNKAQSEGGVGESKGKTAQSSTSQSQSFKRGTRFSQLSDSLFDKTFIPDSTVIRPEVDIMDMSILDRDVKVTVERDVLESDMEMEGRKTPETTPGPSKIQSSRSSKGSTKKEPSTQKHGFYAISSTQPKKRTRSASVDQPLTGTIRKRSVRSKSIDLDDIKNSTAEGKIDLRVMLTPIPELPGPSTTRDAPEDEVSKHSTKAYSDVGAYTTSRRLTRRQASMLKSIGAVEKEIRKLPLMEEIDPLHLFNKEEFEGKPDPDESKVYEQYSPSNSSEATSRHTRSASVLSDVLGTPKRRKSKAISELVDSPASGTRSRLRRQSTDTMSVASEQSDSPSPPKKTKKKDADSETENDSQSVRTKRGRSRTSSVSSTKSAASDHPESSIRTTRSRKIQSVSELPEIQEEKGSDEGESGDTSMVKKRGRKKKK